jgi:hypothetical protein
MGWPDWGSGTSNTGTELIVGTASESGPGLSPASGWTNLVEITATGAYYATWVGHIYANIYSYYMWGTNCGFSIDSGAVVVGVEMMLRLKQDSSWQGNMQGQRQSIVKGGAIDGYVQYLWNLTGTTVYETTRGSPTDMWGSGAGTIVGSDVNASNFGTAWMLNYGGYLGGNTCSVQWMKIKVYFTAEDRTPWGRALVYGLSALAGLPAIGGLADRALAKLRPVQSQTRMARKLEWKNA